MPEITYADALNIAIKEEMRRDESVFIMGESIRGGIYGVTGGLSQEFGDRVIDTPLSENGFMGAAVGAAAVGMRPIVQSLSSFLWVAMDQLISQAAKMRFMFGGQVNLPVVYRCGMIYGANSAAHHTDRPYPMLMNMPGLKIAIPTTPADAKGLLKTAVRDNDPVMFFEDNNLTGTRGEVDDDDDYTIPFGVADVKHEGSDVTVVALAGMLRRAVAVAEELEGRGHIGRGYRPAHDSPAGHQDHTRFRREDRQAGDSGPGSQELQRRVRDLGNGRPGRLLEPPKSHTARHQSGLPLPLQPRAGVRGLPQRRKDSRRHIRDPGMRRQHKSCCYAVHSLTTAEGKASHPHPNPLPRWERGLLE